LFLAATASAQSGFVQGTFGREIKRFSGDTTSGPFDGTATAVTVGGGGFIAPHWTIGAELDLGQGSTTTSTTSVTIAGQVRQIHTDYTSRRRSASALVGYHSSPHHGIRVGCYAGLSFSVVRREILSDADQIVVQEPLVGSVYTDRVAGAIVGLDVAIAVAPHLSVVAALRAQGLSLSGDMSGHSIRPSIGARVTF
jgi:hypothetical protein